MEFDSNGYQRFVKEVSTQKVQGGDYRIIWAAQELVAEAGEVLGVVVKAQRKGTPIDLDKLWDELGDTLWGLAAVMNEAFPDKDFSDLAEHNANKLTERIDAATKTD